MKTLKKLVTMNMCFVLIPKYFWMYQKPKVDAMEQAACAIPRYVISRKENWTMLFWMIPIRDPVVLRPSASRKKATR